MPIGLMKLKYANITWNLILENSSKRSCQWKHMALALISDSFPITPETPVYL